MITVRYQKKDLNTYADKNTLFLSIYGKINNEFYPLEFHKSDQKEQRETDDTEDEIPRASYWICTKKLYEYVQ
jgi:hypothetical protein